MSILPASEHFETFGKDENPIESLGGCGQISKQKRAKTNRVWLGPPNFGSVLEGSHGTPSISGKSRLVKYYSIWPDVMTGWIGRLDDGFAIEKQGFSASFPAMLVMLACWYFVRWILQLLVNWLRHFWRDEYEMYSYIFKYFNINTCVYELYVHDTSPFISTTIHMIMICVCIYIYALA